MACCSLLAKFCKMAVKNACGKYSPDIQKEMGWPSACHRLMNCTLAFKSLYHAVNGFKDKKLVSAQVVGTAFRNRPRPKASKSSVMATKPFMALLKSGSWALRICRSLLYLAASCFKTVLRDSSYFVGKLVSIASKSNKSGVCSMSSAAISYMTTSVDFPPPAPPPLPEVSAMLSCNNCKASRSAHVISQFSCKPNTSGGVVSGRPRKYSKNSSWVDAAGQ
mmetsp:Transcript_1502/g.3320  ORF Transcript_1502/g.3320 Transcript_1502/m.3320 type:complete len:221 (-) Transcript_1502:250-912(-)